MKLSLFSLAAIAIALSACATQDEAQRTARVCLPDSGFCYFPDGSDGQAAVGGGYRR